MNVLIVEDEPMVARRLRRLTASILEEASVDVIRDVDEAREALFDRDVDLLLLDLNLRGRDGFDLLRESVSGAFHTIVVSAYTDRAIEAFELGVVDFVGKPFGRERLAKAFRRVQTGERPDAPAQRLAIRRSGEIRLIEVASVRRLQASGSYTELVLRDGSTELHNKSLHRLVSILPDDFMRIHRSHAVRRSDVRALRSRPGSRYEVELHDGTTLPVGRTRVDDIRDKLEEC